MFENLTRSPTLAYLILETQRALLELHKAGEVVQPLKIECLLNDFRFAQGLGHDVELDTISPKAIRSRLRGDA